MSQNEFQWSTFKVASEQISVDILADSINETNSRATSIEIVLPRIILAELNTPRVFSRSYESSRAVPVEKKIAAVLGNPFVPAQFGRNKGGMQATEILVDAEHEGATQDWIGASLDAVKWASRMKDRGVHKQLANRILEPYSYISGIITAVAWENTLALRTDSAAEGHFQILANKILAAFNASKPKALQFNEWHLPKVHPDEAKELGLERARARSVARVARVSYNRHHIVTTVEEDIKRHDDLLRMGHMGPFEHQVQAPNWNTSYAERMRLQGNLPGWLQYRKMLPGEVRKFPALKKWTFEEASR